MNAEEAKAARSALRERIAAASERTTKTITYAGMEFEIRQVTVKERQRILDRAAKDKVPAGVLLAMASAYVPGTDMRVFDDSDLTMLLSQPSGGVTDALSSAVNDLTQEAMDKGKPSAGALND